MNSAARLSADRVVRMDRDIDFLRHGRPNRRKKTREETQPESPNMGKRGNMKPKQTASVKPFYSDESMGTFIDTRGLPLTHLVRNNTTEESFLDPKFAPLADDRAGRLRNEIPKFIKANSTDAEVRQVLREAGMEDEAGAPGTVYIRANAEEVPVDVRFKDGFWVASAGGKKYSAESRDDLLSAVVRGLNQDVRELSDAELREISILAQSVGFYPAVAKFVSLKTGMSSDEVLSDSALLDSRNARAFDQAVAFCWLSIRADFSPGPDWSEFVSAYANDRHLSAALLDGCRVAYETRKQTMERESIFSQVDHGPVQPEEQPAPTYEQLDAMDEEELQEQFKDVVKERAKLIRRGVL